MRTEIEKFANQLAGMDYLVAVFGGSFVSVLERRMFVGCQHLLTILHLPDSVITVIVIVLEIGMRLVGIH